MTADPPNPLSEKHFPRSHPIRWILMGGDGHTYCAHCGARVDRQRECRPLAIVFGDPRGMTGVQPVYVDAGSYQIGVVRRMTYEWEFRSLKASSSAWIPRLSDLILNDDGSQLIFTDSSLEEMTIAIHIAMAENRARRLRRLGSRVGAPE